MISLLMIVLALITIILFYIQYKEHGQIERRIVEKRPESYETQEISTLKENEYLQDKEPVNPYYPNDLEVPLSSDQGRIKDQTPFTNQSIPKISILIHTNEGEKTFSTPPENKNMILEAFGSINLSTAKANIPDPSEDGVIYIRFHADGAVYSAAYDLNSNTYTLGGQRYFATYNTIVYMNLFCRPGSILAALGEMRIIDMEREDKRGDVVNQSDQYDLNELKVQNLNFAEWYDHIKGDPNYNKQIRYYSIQEDKIETIRMDEGLGILFTGLSVYFTKNEVETAHGISIGSSSNDVISRLGAPNRMSPAKWSYQVDEEQYLHLYMKKKKVQYISLSSL